eukprot:s1686_g2.t1
MSAVSAITVSLETWSLACETSSRLLGWTRDVASSERERGPCNECAEVMRSRSPTRKTESGGVFFWRINQAQYSGAGACAEKIVLSVLEKFGLCRSSEAAGSRLIWANCFEPKLWATAGHCLINHFPRSVELTHKHRLCETLTRCRSRYLPRSFVLPQEDALWHQSLQDMGRPGGRDRRSADIDMSMLRCTVCIMLASRAVDVPLE